LSAAIGVYCVTPYNVDNITQITLASNTGTFLVYGMTCVVAIVAFASRHDKHPLKHYVVPGVGAFMNLAELIGVVFLAISTGGATSKDAYKSIAIVVGWIAIGAIWVALNPHKHHARGVTESRKVEARKPVDAVPV
jgi:amino acid transporter